jgi:cytochrome c5
MLRMLIVTILLLGSWAGYVEASAQTASKATGNVSHNDPAVKTAGVKEDVGEKKFKENCSRCHSAPESFSPRITGTIMRHMRVRASLSAQDEQDILKFLAP